MSTPTMLDAKTYLAFLRSSGRRVPDLGSSVLLALHPAARPARARHQEGPFAAIETARRGRSVPTVSPLGPGSAVAAMTIDLLAELGVGTVIGVGVGSWVERDATPPGPVVIEQAFGDDQVASIYGGHQLPSRPLTARVAAQLGAACVDAFTTPTPFRLDRAALWQSSASVVEMESAALFAAAHAASIEIAVAIIPSDTTALDLWRPEEPASVVRSVREVANRCRQLLVVEGR